MEVDKGIKLEETESKDFVNSGVKVKKEYEGCIRCLELQDKITKADDKCSRLELDIGKKKSVIESLEGKLGFMELKYLKIENEVRVLKQKNEELENIIRNSKEEDDRLTHMMIENKVLECEKNRAESENGVWKLKCKELEMQVMELEKRLSAEMTKTGGPSMVRTQDKTNEDKDASGTPPIITPSKQYTNVEGFKGRNQGDLKSRVKKCLDFAAEGSPHKNISPSTPGGRPPFGPIEISDSDDDLNAADVHISDIDSKTVQSSTGVGLGITPDEKELTSKDRCAVIVEGQSDEEDVTCCIARPPYLLVPKRRKVRRGVAYVINSESENDSDDNIPICRLRSENRRPVNDSCSIDNHKKHTPRRRLVRVGDNEKKDVSGRFSYKSSENQNNIGTPEIMNDSSGEDEMEKDDSSSEGESLGGFIVNNSDVSEGETSENDGTFSGDCSGDSGNASESSMAYDEVISGLRRDRKDKMKWEYEADMLADFGKFPEMCMKAVCALYRQQTCEEKSCKATIHINGRGFNQIHAFSGSALAEFLTDGDPQGDLKKSVKELQEFDSKGVEKCRKLATHYSKQLFEIYKNKEDPYFHP
ncbi:hypothetical protein DH2020_009842 [Rehmannia glutinosa]|uniref:Uncharacterized protein n=1 Tax=Rehmannia glutinosa TaxID=99300 RepID=A0ABR0X9P8_REHGL